MYTTQNRTGMFTTEQFHNSKKQKTYIIGKNFYQDNFAML